MRDGTPTASGTVRRDIRRTARRPCTGLPSRPGGTRAPRDRAYQHAALRYDPTRPASNVKRTIAFIFFGGILWAEVRSLTILHTNDLHSRLSPDAQGRGGFAYLASAIRREKADCPQCIVLDAGDVVQGHPASTLYRGVPAFKLANRLGIDVACLGNHEFDYGWEMISTFRKIAKYPLVSANVTNGEGAWIGDAPYLTRTINGVRLGIIGAMLGTLPDMTTLRVLGPWRALPVVETVRKYAAELHPRVDLNVVVGHISEGPDILREVPEVAVVVSGHNHGGLKEPVRVGERLEVRVAGYGIELGRLDLQVDLDARRIASSTWKRIPIDSRTIPAAPDVAREVAEWDAKVAKVVDVPIGESRRMMAQPEVRALMERAIVEELGVDLAFVNRGGVRDVIPQGQLLARHIWNVMPFDNRMVTGRFPGSQLPAAAREGRAIDPAREYTFAVPDFVAFNQSSNFGVNGLEFPQAGPLLRDLLIDWVKKKKVLE